jgi:SAM-dependent methyltransferase
VSASDPFADYVNQYEAWFEQHRYAYQAEVRAVKALLPATGLAVEIGVGTGRFAEPLGIQFGVDPSRAMLHLARERGVMAVLGVGESLPFPDSTFDNALMVTAVCFLDDIHRAFVEARRILHPEGAIVVGLVDEESPVGRLYLERREESVFYSHAHFFSVEGIVYWLERTGFHGFEFRQTLFGLPAETPNSEPVEPGYGDGSFVVVRAIAQEHIFPKQRASASPFSPRAS